MHNKPKSCGDCTLCCKLPEINDPEYHKKSFSYCKNCNLSKGSCNIYENRPMTCKTFECFYLEDKTDLKPNDVGFFIFAEQHIIFEHGEQKIRTIYCEKNRLKDLISNLNKDKKIKALIDDGYAFHIRYDENDKHIKIYDPKAFGENLVFMHKNWSINKQNEVVNKFSLQEITSTL